MKAFYELCEELGFTVVFFLMDRVDEFPDTANNPELQANLLAPFLGHLHLLEMKGIAFKFFLPDMVREELISRSWLRLDRIRIKASRLDWSGARLVQLLNERMGVFSQQQITDLGQICQSKMVADQIEQWIHTAESPRELLLVMQKLCGTHVSRAPNTALLTLKDWQTVKDELLIDGKMEGIVNMPESEKEEVILTSDKIPILRVEIARHLAWLDMEPIEMTPIQFKILKALIESNGRCSREELAEKVWGNREGVTDETIDRNISRLREKLGDSREIQNYLETVRGWGFELKNHISI
jgi:DNA-binding response OmpR family regulator